MAARKRKSRYYEHPKDDKWDGFETFKGLPRQEWPGWLDLTCRIFFGLLGWGCLFAIGGAVLFFLPYALLPRTGGISRWFVEQEESWMAWGRFLVGGIIACWKWGRYRL